MSFFHLKTVQPKLLKLFQGGIILRSLISTFPQNSDIAPLVITLATPHKRPPAIFDNYMANFYKNMESHTSNKTIIISIAGGYNDFLVPSYLSQLNGGFQQNLYAVVSMLDKVFLKT